MDRTASLALRNIAKTVVAAGAASECEIQAAYAIGVAEPVSLTVSTYGTGRISEEKIAEWIGRHYDLRPAGMIEQFRLRQPIYRQAAGNGSFGRTDVRFPWEEISQEALEDLRSML